MGQDITAQWTRVDDLLSAACSQLGVGEMIQCETFSLFEAMSAVEVGNPKMDATAHVSRPVAELVAEGRAPTDLTLRQQLAVMERLLLLEAGHYCMAAPLAASIYTSLYMMDIARLESAVPFLSAFCFGLHQSCIAARWIVFNGAVSEEEDFSLLVAGLPCEVGVPPNGTALPDPACLQKLSTAIEKARPVAAGSAGHDDQENVVREAITVRLVFRREILAAMVELQRKTPSSLAACHAHCAAALTALDSFTTAEVSQEEVDNAHGFVEGLNRHLLGPAPPRVIKIPATLDAWSAVKRMLQHLQEATLVMDAKEFRQVKQWIERFSSLGASIIPRSAAHYLVAGKVWAAAAAAPTSTPQQQQPQPGGLPTLHSAGPSSPSCSWALDRPLLCEALALPVKPPIGTEVELFLEQAVIAIGNWAQAMFLNPCRQRRRLRRGLDDWANLYQHALNADLSPHMNAWMNKAGWHWVPGQAGPPNPVTGDPDLQGPLATWVAAGTASCQLLHLQLGWQLELYSPSEYCCLYWYCHNLLTGKRAALQLLHSINAPAGGKLPLLPGKGGKGAKAKALPPASPATITRQASLMSDAVFTELCAHMCSGLTRLMVALEKAGLVQQPFLPFNTMRERFDQRFSAFHSPSLVRPDPLSIDQYHDAMRTDGLTPADVIQLAAQAFAEMRRDYSTLKNQQALQPVPSVVESFSREQLTELAAMDRVAATNTLAAMVLIKSWGATGGAPEPATGDGVKSKPSMTVSFDFSNHRFFPTLKVKSTA